jgi:hypothetical protein
VCSQTRRRIRRRRRRRRLRRNGLFKINIPTFVREDRRRADQRYVDTKLHTSKKKVHTLKKIEKDF